MRATFNSTASTLMLVGLIVIVTSGGAVALRLWSLVHHARRFVRTW